MILIFGKTGQVATEFKYFDETVLLDRRDADLSNPQSCEEAIYRHNPKLVINAAAYTSVDLAEDNEQLAITINATSPTIMALACSKLAIPFVHISSDYVFDGSGENPWNTDNITNPKNAYGRSKLMGEQGIIDSGAIYAILRTSWIFSSNGANFVTNMLKLSQTNDFLRIVSDQIGGPTPAYDIAKVCLDIGRQLINDSSKSSIYHYSGGPDVSWYDFAKEIFMISGIQMKLKPIKTSEYITPALRPLNSRLDMSKTERNFQIHRPNWRHGLINVLQDLNKIS
jgi:dTDP-4-dehydrorhamnose reductase